MAAATPSTESHETLAAWLKKHQASATKDLVAEIGQPPLPRPPQNQNRIHPYGEVTCKPSATRKREQSTGAFIDYQDVRLLLYHHDLKALGEIVLVFSTAFDNKDMPALAGHMRTEPFAPVIEPTKEKVEGNDVHKATLTWTVWRHIVRQTAA